MVVTIKEDLGWIQAMFDNLGIHAIALRQYNESRLKTLMGCCGDIRAQHNALDIIEHCSLESCQSSLTLQTRREIGRKYAEEVIASLRKSPDQ